MKSFPIVTYLSDTSVPVSEIYFPAVTVCPNFLPYIPKRSPQFVSSKKYFRFEKHTTKRYFYEDAEYLEESVDERKLKGMSYVNILKRLEKGQLNSKDLGQKMLKRLQVIDLISKSEIFYKLNFSIPTDDFLDVINEFEKEFLLSWEILYFSFIFDSEQYVSENITPYGLCQTFNLALPEDLLDFNTTSDDFHYQFFPKGFVSLLQSRLPEFPRKDSPYPDGLKMSIMVSNYLVRNAIKRDFEGYRFILHDPFELPSSSSNIYLMSNNKETKIKIAAQINTIDDSIAGYHPKDRNCYLENERKLKFFRKYSKSNCIQECLTEFMIRKCGCVEFYMIRNLTSRICSASEKFCYENARNDFSIQQESCGCLQACNYVKYEYEVIEKGFKSAIPGRFVLFVSAEFGEVKYNPLIRKQQFSELDFFSYFGGLLGLFAGISVLSIIEIIYWFTIQLIEGRIFKAATAKIVPLNGVAEEKSKFVKLKEFVKKFLMESSIHGIGYIVGSNFIQRFVWIVITMFSMTTCFFIISDTREKIPDSRVVAYDDHFKFIENIKFPAVTIVPEFTVKNEARRNLTNFARLSAKNLRLGKIMIPSKKILSDAVEVVFCSVETFVSFGHSFYDLLPYTVDMVKRKSNLEWFQKQTFIYNGKYHPVFSAIPTSRGMGYTFNILDADELLNFKSNISEFRYFKNVTAKSAENSSFLVHDIRINKGNKAELSITLKKRNYVNETGCLPLGFLIHNEEMPRFTNRQDFSSFQYGMDVLIEITPEIIRTDENLKKLDPQDRECYFEGEKSLKFFKKYSENNCVTECMANYFLNYCGCNDKIWKPVENENYCYKFNKTNECSAKYMMGFLMLNFPSSPNCSCLPTCNSETFNIKYFYKFAAEKDEISINVRVNSEDIILFRRYQQFSLSDVVSYVGGLLGLFAGISMLSIFEFFYFFFIRTFVNIFRKQ